ncbi:hypothetical protein [Nonomuraea recticatena]|uniref:Uncharacterized protein n=1 Tax=Nonomuraea recticatena TaxID=46178 RepID=A0ABP6EDJ4_9ACTN
MAERVPTRIIESRQIDESRWQYIVEAMNTGQRRVWDRAIREWEPRERLDLKIGYMQSWDAEGWFALPMHEVQGEYDWSRTKTSRHLFEVGAEIEGELTIVHTFSTKETRDPYWGYLFVDDFDNVLKWFAPEPIPKFKRGRRVRIKAVVKRHDVNPKTGVKVTVLKDVWGGVIK